MKLRHAVCLAAFLVGCHRDLKRAEDEDAGGTADAEQSDTALVGDSGGIDSDIDSTIEDGGPDGADSATDSGAEVADTGGDACSTATCTTPPDATCASSTTRRTYAATGTCTAGACSYAETETPCASGEVCNAGVCTPRSCVGGLACGTVSCCDSPSAPGGTFAMGRGTAGADATACSTWASPCDSNDQPQHDATVASFRLDTFEVTVGRFRKFVAEYPSSRPTAGAGSHPSIAGSGWQTAWDTNLPLTRVDLIATLKSDSPPTWTDTPGGNELKPINCVDWYLAFAFCAWDGGRLPTEAEWEYAAAGGAENRVMQWVNSAPSTTLANFGCTSACTVADIRNVGSTPLGAGRWGQQDLTGNIMEWTLDWYANYTSTAVTNFAQLGTGFFGRVTRGGSFVDPIRFLKVSQRFERVPGDDIAVHGIRCARNP